MKKRLFGILLSFALMLTMVPVLSQTAYAENGDLTVKVLVPKEEWKNDTSSLETGDLQGFVPSTAEAAQAWTGAPSSGDAWLIYGSPVNNGWPTAYFENGVFKKDIPAATYTKKDIYDAARDYSTRIYYTCESPEVITYPIWVKGRQVTSANKDNVLGDGKVSYDPETNTLKLDGADIKSGSGEQYNDAAIFYGDGGKDLIIDATNASTVTGPDVDMGFGIYSYENLIFKGTLSVTGAYCGINCFGNNITVNGKVAATAKEIGIYLDAGDVTINSGADLSSVGDGLVGIAVNKNKGTVTVKEGAKVVAVGGGEAGAIDGIVKNAISGTAWTDKDGTAGETAIEVNTDEKEFDKTFKKAQFPAVQYAVTYDLNGGTLDGQTGIVTKKIDACTVITLPAPTRDGYTFDYWEGSKYKAGDKYTVTADHTFKAVWKTADKGGGSDSGDKGGSSKKGVNTGDENALGAWIVLMLAALAGTAGMVFARKRKG